MCSNGVFAKPSLLIPDGVHNSRLDFCHIRLPFELVFPDSDDDPALFSQLAIVRPSQCDVALNFARPILRVCCRQRSATVWATMPEATINEDDDPFPFEDHVRLAWQAGDILLPPSQTHSGQDGKEASFEFRSLPFDRLHRPPAIFRSEVVGHFPRDRAGLLATHSQIAATRFGLAD